MTTHNETYSETVRDGAMKAARVVNSYATPAGVGPRESGEGSITKTIESVTSQIPSGTFLTVALGSMAASALLQMAGRKNDAQFIGQWVPTILIMGLYNKLVKLEGSE